jgi:uncharacterized protein YceK
VKKITVVFGLVTLLSLQGCAAVMASNQPHKKNLTGKRPLNPMSIF